MSNLTDQSTAAQPDRRDKTNAARLAQAYFNIALPKESSNAGEAEIDAALEQASCEYERLANA